jgi:hypothetical protein
MNMKTITSIAVIIAVAAAIIDSSSTFVSPVLAKTTTTSQLSNSKDITASSSTGSTSSQQDYKDFQKCLTNAEDTKGYATKSEIKDCFNPIYPSATSTSSSSSLIKDPTVLKYKE